MFRHIKDAITLVIELTLFLVSTGTFAFMWFVFFNGFIFAGLFLLVVCVLSYAAMTWLIENSWRF